MKYLVKISVVDNGSVSVEADSVEEAKEKAEEAVLEDRVLYHETEVKECKIEGYF